MSTILLIEDEAAIRDMITYTLGREKFDVSCAIDVTQAKSWLMHNTPDLILLDWMLPDTSGIAFIPQLKAKPHTKNIPLIMLTAKAQEDNKVRGLNSGADDYITKPFSPRELVARIKSVLRRGPLVDPRGMITMQNLAIDTNARTVTIDDQKINLSHNEFKLLLFLARHPNRVFSREQLLNNIWGRQSEVELRAVDVQVRRLRKALNYSGFDKTIKTVRSVGYKFCMEH